MHYVLNNGNHTMQHTIIVNVKVTQKVFGAVFPSPFFIFLAKLILLMTNAILMKGNKYVAMKNKMMPMISPHNRIDVYPVSYSTGCLGKFIRISLRT